MSIKFDYNEEKDTLIVKEDNKTTVFKLYKNKYGKLFRYIIKAIDCLDGSDDGDDSNLKCEYSGKVFSYAPHDEISDNEIFSFLAEGLNEENPELSEFPKYTVILDGTEFTDLEVSCSPSEFNGYSLLIEDSNFHINFIINYQSGKEYPPSYCSNFQINGEGDAGGDGTEEDSDHDLYIYVQN